MTAGYEAMKNRPLAARGAVFFFSPGMVTLVVAYQD